MDFVFKNVSEIDRSSLCQGDVISRSQEVEARISEAHQYYASAPDYTHFVVITQSCDLVRRRGNFNAPYITIAAAKPFKKTIKDFLGGQQKNVDGSSFSYVSASVLGKAKQLIERHINNTEPEFFFLPSSGHPDIPEDLVVFLRLTIALRKDHYDALATAKIAELADVFQAKLGWLKGNIYSRVATPDIEERSVNGKEIKKQFYSKYVPEDEIVWLSPLQASLLKKIVRRSKEKLGRDLSVEEVLDLISERIPDDTQIIASNIVERLGKNKLINTDDEDVVKKFARSIANEPSFKALVKSTKA